MELVKVDSKDTKNTKEIALRDFIRFARKATQGIGQSTEAQAKDLLGKLVRAGHLSQAEEGKILGTLFARMKHSRDYFEKRVGDAVSVASKKLVELSTRELARIEKHISELEKRLEKTSKTKR